MRFNPPFPLHTHVKKKNDNVLFIGHPGSHWVTLLLPLSIPIQTYNQNGNNSLSFESIHTSQRNKITASVYIRSVCSPSGQTQNNWLEVQIWISLCILVLNSAQLIRRIDVPFKDSGDHLIQAQYPDWLDGEGDRKKINGYLWIVSMY